MTYLINPTSSVPPIRTTGQNAFSRTALMLGWDNLEKLAAKRIVIFGVGGVGSFAAEALIRAGLFHLTLIDDDLVCVTNLNRQLHATCDTIGLSKVDAMRIRLQQINPDAEITTIQAFHQPGSNTALFEAGYDYIIDAIDTVTAKIDLAVQAQNNRIPLISCMGAGNKLDPTRFEVTDLANTSVCPLARVMRRELRKRGIEHLKVVYSRETPRKPLLDEVAGCAEACACPAGATRHCATRRQLPASISFVPSVAGLIAAGEVVKDLLSLSNPPVIL